MSKHRHDDMFADEAAVLPPAPRFAPLMSSDDQTWNTPRWFIHRLVRALGPIGLDPCSNSNSIVNAIVEWRDERGEDGLGQFWAGHGLVYVNPPFGDALPTWLRRCAVDGDEVVCLVPSRTDTKWWHEAVNSCDAAVLWKGRFAFRIRAGTHGNAPFPSVVFYWGNRIDAFMAEFQNDGMALSWPERRSRG